jgi:hypothetical protein
MVNHPNGLVPLLNDRVKRVPAWELAMATRWRPGMTDTPA